MNENQQFDTDEDFDALGGTWDAKVYEDARQSEWRKHFEEDAKITPALEAAGLMAFVGWLDKRANDPKVQSAYNLAVEYALSIYKG